ncbi:MAG: hypothetical protein M1835_008024 [Candelina submexicana]|nr:MAG: hypothetical protein M1835_008024 [Candelina submexicana]
METVATLDRISRERLSSLLLSQQKTLSTASKIAIIDVRDGGTPLHPTPPNSPTPLTPPPSLSHPDYIGGHILTSTHIPSQTLPDRTPSLVHALRDTRIVVFHCALSQQRGPTAALQYLRERKRVFGDDAPQSFRLGVGDPGRSATAGEGGEGVLVGEEGAEFEKGSGTGETEGRGGEQEVYVLDGGFVKWQEKYGGDERLTEGWVREIWE